MAETHDTIDSLLAEFRGYAAGMPPSYHVTMSWADFRRMLDRFEAAHDHDVDTATDASVRSVVGACVKLQEAERKCVALREALERCRNCAQMIPQFVQGSTPKRSSLDAVARYANAIVGEVKAALAETEKAGGNKNGI